MKQKRIMAVFLSFAMVLSFLPYSYISAAGESNGISFEADDSVENGFKGRGSTQLKIETDYTQVAAPEDIGFSVKVPKAITFNKDLTSVNFNVTTELNDGTDAADVPRNGYDLTVSPSHENTVTNLTNEGDDLTIVVSKQDDENEYKYTLNSNYLSGSPFAYKAFIRDASADAFKDEYEGGNITWSISFTNNHGVTPTQTPEPTTVPTQEPTPEPTAEPTATPHVHDYSEDAILLTGPSAGKQLFDTSGISYGVAPGSSEDSSIPPAAALRHAKKCSDLDCYAFRYSSNEVLLYGAYIFSGTGGSDVSGSCSALVPNNFNMTTYENTIKMLRGHDFTPSSNPSYFNSVSGIPAVIMNNTGNMRFRLDTSNPDYPAVIKNSLPWSINDNKSLSHTAIGREYSRMFYHTGNVTTNMGITSFVENPAGTGFCNRFIVFDPFNKLSQPDDSSYDIKNHLYVYDAESVENLGMTVKHDIEP